MNKQEIYNVVREHLLKQKERSSNDVGQCLYRGPRGLKCAIGVLIKDEEYSPEMESRCASALVRDFRIAAFPHVMETNDLSLLNGLQFIHDDSPPHAWRSELDKLAEDYNLIVE